MKVKHTYLTLFRVSESGLEMVGPFPTEQEARQHAEDTELDAFTIIPTTVVEEVEMKRESTMPGQRSKSKKSTPEK